VLNLVYCPHFTINWVMKQRSLTLNNNNNFANFLEVCIISRLYFSHMKFCCMTYIMVNFLELYLIKPSFFSNFGICCTFCNLFECSITVEKVAQQSGNTLIKQFLYGSCWPIHTEVSQSVSKFTHVFYQQKI
jgi:hypothetical protein